MNDVYEVVQILEGKEYVMCPATLNIAEAQRIYHKATITQGKPRIKRNGVLLTIHEADNLFGFTVQNARTKGVYYATNNTGR